MTAYGIDLGTTTTLIARAYAGLGTETINADIMPIRQKIMRNGAFSEINIDYMPSIAHFPHEGGALVGSEALTISVSEGSVSHSVRAVKRLMGQSFLLPEPINRTAADISALYLTHVLRGVSFSSRDELTVTVPASFTANQRRDTLQALQTACRTLGVALPDAKIGNLLISEPVAALLANLAEDLQLAEPLRRLNIDKSPLVLVYDIGGGTLDLTLVKLEWRNPAHPKNLSNLYFDVRELNRYNQFGGEDFDIEVAGKLLTHFIEANPELEQLDLTDAEVQQVRFSLIDAAEQLKKSINEELGFALPGESITLSFTLPNPITLREREYGFTDWEISSQDYETWVAPFLTYRADPRNTLYPIESLLARSDLSLNDVDYFLLVGGMARFAPLQTALQAAWQRDTGFLTTTAPHQNVAKGAAVYSFLKARSDQFGIDEPAADAYYVRKSDGFSLLLDRGSVSEGDKGEYTLTGEGSDLRLEIFAGESPETTNSLESIYPSLVYQGSVLVPLGKKYSQGTKVWIQMLRKREDYSKMPSLKIWVNTETNLVSTISYNQLHGKD